MFNVHEDKYSSIIIQNAFRWKVETAFWTVEYDRVGRRLIIQRHFEKNDNFLFHMLQKTEVLILVLSKIINLRNSYDLK